MTIVTAFDIFMFIPSDYYMGTFPWEGMFPYIGVYVLHLLIWAIFRNEHYRWAYGVDAVPENLDREYSDYCCKAMEYDGRTIANCLIHFEEVFSGDVCKEYGTSQW